MNKKELILILSEGEGQYIEFKENFESKNFSKEIVAFANASGGKIVLGVDDNGEVRGVRVTNKLKSQIQDLANNCDPPIKLILEELEKVLVVEIFEGKDKPYSCSSGFYLRVGSNSQKLKRDEILDFIFSEGKKSFDEIFTGFRDYSKNLVEKYLKRIGVKEKIDDEVLFNLGVSDEKGNLNNAGILFFTERPKKYLINAFVTCARYKGTDKVDVIDRKDFEDDLISQVENSMEFVKRNTKLSYKIEELEREEIPEYPTEAVREALLNSIMHRDYFSLGGNVQVDIYDDRLTITNVGGLMKPLTLENFGKIAVRRNPLIADLFHRIHFIERMGTGIKRIRNSCKEHGGVEYLFETNGYFISEFRLIKDGIKDGINLSDIQFKILKGLEENSFITTGELSKKININLRNTEKNIYKLKELGLLERVGSRKKGYWKIKSTLNSQRRLLGK